MTFFCVCFCFFLFLERKKNGMKKERENSVNVDQRWLGTQWFYIFLISSMMHQVVFEMWEGKLSLNIHFQFDSVRKYAETVRRKKKSRRFRDQRLLLFSKKKKKKKKLREKKNAQFQNQFEIKIEKRNFEIVRKCLATSSNNNIHVILKTHSSVKL